MDVDPPVTRYARSGVVHVAYQVFGDGPLDLVLVNGGWQHLDHQWNIPAAARYLRKLGALGRVVVFQTLVERAHAHAVVVDHERVGLPSAA